MRSTSRPPRLRASSQATSAVRAPPRCHPPAWATAAWAARARPADVIHTHCPTALPLARFAGAPMVYTLHHERSDALADLYALQRGVRFVAISGRQRELTPELGGS